MSLSTSSTTWSIRGTQVPLPMLLVAFILKLGNQKSNANLFMVTSVQLNYEIDNMVGKDGLLIMQNPFCPDMQTRYTSTSMNNIAISAATLHSTPSHKGLYVSGKTVGTLEPAGGVIGHAVIKPFCEWYRCYFEVKALPKSPDSCYVPHPYHLVLSTHHPLTIIRSDGESVETLPGKSYTIGVNDKLKLDYQENCEVLVKGISIQWDLIGGLDHYVVDYIACCLRVYPLISFAWCDYSAASIGWFILVAFKRVISLPCLLFTFVDVLLFSSSGIVEDNDLSIWLLNPGDEFEVDLSDQDDRNNIDEYCCFM